jgi:diguanylate cyclase (GGDEF)-like protein
VAEIGAIWIIGAAGTVLLTVLIAAMWQFLQLSHSLDRQAALTAAAFAQHDRLLQMVNEETGMRGYVATGDPAYLDVYETAKAVWRRDAAAVEQTQAVFPRLTPRVRRSIGLSLELQRYFAGEIVLMRAHRADLAKRNLSRGKALFDRLRALDTQVQQAANAEMRKQRVHSVLLAKAGFTSAVTLSGILVVWALAFLLILGRARAYRASSFIDSLTGVRNRRGAAAAIQAQLAAQPPSFGLVFIDLDGFKKINDAHGHAAGDAILRDVAARLQQELREGDSVCRVGGDEFLCVLAPPATREQVSVIARRLRRSIAQSYSFRGNKHVIGCSVGVSMYPDHGTTSEVLIARADSAMYRAKAAGGGVVEAPSYT